MQTLEALRRKVHNAEDLHSIVKTMKALAAVSIRQYEKAVESLRDYFVTVELGFQVLLQKRPAIIERTRQPKTNRLGAIVFGSDQGMCGQLNDQIVSYAIHMIRQYGIEQQNLVMLAFGERIFDRLEDAGFTVEDILSVPTSIDGITPRVQDVLLKIEQWSERDYQRVLLFYSRPSGGASYQQTMLSLIPFDREWLKNLQNKEWESPSLPQFTLDWDFLFSALVRQYLFVALYRAFAESLASENASRLASMQSAEKNIEDRLNELQAKYNHFRQLTITEELLDISAGFEALTGEEQH